MKETSSQIKDFTQLIDRIKESGIRKRVAIVWPEEEHTQLAIRKAVQNGFISPTLFCSKAIEEQYRSNPEYTCITKSDPVLASQEAVRYARQGKVDIIMKGFVSTDILLKAILNKEEGILPKGNIMTHITVADLPTYDKLLFFTDAAVIPFPTDQQREAQVRYVKEVCQAFNIECPRISLLHCLEKPDGRHFPYTMHYLKLKEKCQQGEFGECIIDGPLDLKTSCSEEALKYKGITSPIEGRADALVFPNIEAGNVFYKTITLFDDALTAAILKGTLVPVVLPSRGDDINTKFYSLALAVLTA